MLYYKPNPGPPPEFKPPWKHRRMAINLAIWAAAFAIIGFFAYQAVWVFNRIRSVNWPDPNTFPVEVVANRAKNANLPVTIKRLIYIDIDDNTFIFVGSIKPKTWLAKLAKPDGKIRDLSDEEEAKVRYLFVIQRKNQPAILAITSSPNKLGYIREVLSTGVK